MKNIIQLIELFLIILFFTTQILSMGDYSKSCSINLNTLSRIEILASESTTRIFKMTFKSIIKESVDLDNIINKSIEYIEDIKSDNPDLINNFIAVMLKSNKFKKLLNQKLDAIIRKSSSLDNAINNYLEYIKNIRITEYNCILDYITKLFKEAIYKTRFFQELKNIKSKNKNKALLETIKSYGLSLDFKLCKIDLLIDAGADVNSRPALTSTPLIAAAVINSVEIIDLLIKKGANINYTDFTSRTALMFAVTYNNNLEAAKYLIEKNINIDAVDRFNKTALIYAAEKEYNYQEAIALLIKHGADVNIKDIYGKTANYYYLEKLRAIFNYK